MATIYLRSTDGNDADDGSTWALAKATMQAALTAAGAGGTVYVSQAHDNLIASATTITSPGTAADPVNIICVNDGAEPPTTLATTARFGTSSNNQLTLAGFAYVYGCTVQAGSSGTANFQMCTATGTDHCWYFDTCKIVSGSTTTSGAIFIGGSGTASQGTLIVFDNTTVKFNADLTRALVVRCPFIWTNTASAIDTGGTVPTTLFKLERGVSSTARLFGVDLSAMGSGKTLVGFTTTGTGRVIFENCKLGASVTISETPGAPGGEEVIAVNCDSADTNYRFYSAQYSGAITQEATIVRSGGATISRKMVANANSDWRWPLRLGDLRRYNTTTGSSITVSVEVITDNVTLTDAEAWIEVEYLGTSGLPLSLFSSDRAGTATLVSLSGATAAANQPTSSETWTTTGLTTPVKQTLSVSVTPQEQGVVIARVCLAKASTTMYVCPQLEIT